MAAIDQVDLSSLSVTATKKPEKSSGVTVSQIPEALISLLKIEAPKALDKKDQEILLTLPYPPKPEYAEGDKTPEKDRAEAISQWETSVKQTDKNVALLASYATAWGKGQTPKLYIHKIPNRKDMAANIARLMVETDSDAKPKPGRPASN